MGHGTTLRQDVPSWMLRLLTRYEHLLMRSINHLATREWIYSRPFTRRMVEWLSVRVLRFANGEILALPEVLQVIESLFSSGETVAIGTCPCRRARNNFSDETPNNTDMVFGLWAEQYLDNYPEMYRRLSEEEALCLVEEFDHLGLVHQVYGFNSVEGAAYVLCNCAANICIPLQAQKSRGFQSFRKGRSRAGVDAGSCLGIEECGACLTRCTFGARVAWDRKPAVLPEECFGCGLCLSTCKGEATKLERVPGARLIYAGHLVK